MVEPIAYMILDTISLTLLKRKTFLTYDSLYSAPLGHAGQKLQS